MFDTSNHEHDLKEQMGNLRDLALKATGRKDREN